MKNILPLLIVYFCFPLKSRGQILNPMANNEEIKFTGNVSIIKIKEYGAINKFGFFVNKGEDSSIAMYYFNQLNLLDSAYGIKKNKNSLKIGKSEITYENINNELKIVKTTKRRRIIRDSILYNYNYLNIYKYDDNGNIVENIKYKNDSLTNIEVAQYSAQNKILNYKTYQADGQINWERKYNYDSKGNVIQEVHYNNSNYYSHEKYRYSANNKLMESTRYSIGGDLLSTTKFIYSPTGMLLQENLIALDNPEWNSVTNYNYNNLGLLTSKFIYYDNGIQELKELNLYDEKGRLIEHETSYAKETFEFDGFDNMVKHTTYYYNSENVGVKTKKSINSISKVEFVYDTEGNWIKKIKSYTDKESNSLSVPNEYEVSERIIKYR